MSGLFSSFVLPNGISIKNRIAKAAMEENLAEYSHTPGERILKLYDSWANGGVGVIITGNVMIDSRAATGPGGIVLEDERNIAKFQKWAEIIKKNGALALMQINHPGRQMPKDLDQPTIAPSAVSLQLGIGSSAFTVPREMTAAEISETIMRFANTASFAEKAGFDGVEIHAAHGYLISQFLSPLTNKRADEWGGSLENRTRFLLEVVKSVRAKVRKEFVVAVKLNSADFQRGGFSPEEAKSVVSILNSLSVDLVELSGGSYEAPAMMGQSKDSSTLARKAYFLEFAKDISSIAKMPLMITGGVRRKEIAEYVVSSGVAMVGIATALALNPNLVNDWQNNILSSPKLRTVNWKNKSLNSMASMSMVRYQFRRIVSGQYTNLNVSPWIAFLQDFICRKVKSREYRNWLREKNQ